MLSINNKSEQLRKDTAKPNRFALRKLSVGVCSVLVGLTFMGLNASADQLTTSSNEVKTEAVVQAAPSASQAATSSTNSAASSAANSSEATQSAANSNADQTASPVTQNSSANQNNSENNSASVATNSSAAPASQANVDQVNVNDWTYTKRDDGITLTGFNGHIVDGKIIVPNSYDFAQAGIISAGQKVYIDGYFRNNWGVDNTIHRKYGSQASEFMISHNGDGKVYATGNWGDAFNGVPYKVMDLTNLDVSGVDRMSQMFCWSQKLERIIGLDHWDTSNVGDMGSMFYFCPNLTDIGDISGWNVSKVTNMSAMFAITNVRTTGNLSNWDVSSAKDMHQMFAYTSQLTDVGNLSSWNVSNVENANKMFYKTNLSNIDIHGWNLSKATDVDRMFGFSLRPLEIDMRGVTLPNRTNFDLMSFYGDKPMVVYSDAGSQLFKLNNTKLDNYDDRANTLLMITDTGRQKANHLTLRNNNGDVIATLPMNFVFTDKNDLIKQMQEKTEKSTVNQLVANKYGDKVYVANDLFDNNNPQSLNHNFNQNATTLVADTYDIRAVKDIAPDSQDDQNKTLTRTIHITKPDGTSSKTTQQVHFKRVNTVDAITNEHVSYGDWQLTDGSWAAVDVPTIAGYTPFVDGKAASSVAAETVDPNKTTDKTVEVCYQPTDQTYTQNIIYQDAKGNPVHTASITGHFDAENPATLSETDLKNAINANIPTNWKVVDGFTYPAAVTINNQNPSDIVVTIEHATKEVQPTDPNSQDLVKTVTRTINVTNPDGKSSQIKQTVSFNRTKIIDLVTNQVISYSDWTLANGSAANWAAFDVPQLTGYTSLVDGQPAKQIAQQNVTVNSTDKTYNVSYQAINHPTDPTVDPIADVIFQTADGHIVGRSSIHGNVGQTISLNLQVPAGYEAVNGLPTQYTFTDAANQQLIILVRAITPDHPDTPDKPDTPDVPDQPDKPDQPDTPDQPVSPDHPIKPDQPVSPDQTGKSTNIAAPVVAKGQVAPANDNKTQQLPQTGNDKSSSLAGLGLSLTLLLGLVGLKKKRHE